MSFAFLQDELALALCWTLIHSLWQGVLLAAATAVVMVSTRKSHARKRYNLLAVLFFLFIAATVFTFCRELRMPRTAIAAAQASSQSGLPSIASVNVIDSGNQVISQTWVQNFTAYFNEHAVLIVTIWFIIFIAKFLRLSANLVYVQRIRSYKIYEPPAGWKEKMDELMRKLHLGGPIRLMESGMIKAPVTVGMLKPVILFPLGLLSHLPPDEIEAILLHELAHIRRRDYFVNLLQSFAETIFFFNPAVLWLSSVIRDERENCCDDLAISVTRSKANFINALISFQEYHFAQPSNVLAFPGTKNQLLNRVKRIVSDRNKTLDMTEKSILSLSIALFVLFSFVAARSKPPAKPGLQGAVVTGDTRMTKQITDGPNTAIIREKPDTGRRIARVSPDLAENAARTDATQAERSADLASLHQLAPNTIIGDTLPEFKSVSTDITEIDGLRTMIMTVATREGKQYRFRKVNEELKELAINGKDIPQAEFKNYQEEIRLIEEVYWKHKEEKRRLREQQNLARIHQIEEQKRLLHKKQQNLFEQRQLEQEKRRLMRMNRLGPDGPSPDKLEKLRKLQEKDDKKRQAAAAVMRNIIDDLAKENITIDIEKSWFALDKNQFVVNGKPMSEEMHKRFRSRYVVPHDGMGWYYGQIQGSSGRGIFLGSKETMSR